MVKLITWSWASLSLRWCFKLIDPPPKSSRPESRFSRWITPKDLTFCTCSAKCSQNCFSVDSVVSDSRKEALEKRVANVRAISYDDFTDFWNKKGLITSATKSSDSQVVPIWNKSLLSLINQRNWNHIESCWNGMAHPYRRELFPRGPRAIECLVRSVQCSVCKWIKLI